MIRGIALHELAPGTTRRLLVKESVGALINGVAVAIGTGAAVFLWDGRPGLVLIIGFAVLFMPLLI